MAESLILDENELIELDGKFKDSKRYWCRNHIFYKRRDNNSNTETYTCSYANHALIHCTAKIKRIAGKLVLDKSKGKHERHASSANELKIVAMKNALKEAAKFQLAPQVAYDRVAPSHEDAAKLIPPKQVEHVMNKAKKDYQIDIKKTLDDQAIAVAMHPIFKEYYQICTHPQNKQDGTMIIFAKPSVLERLNNAEELFIDGNFKIVPTRPTSMQTWNILIKEKGPEKIETARVCFAWCTHAHPGTYTEILRYLKEKAPMLENNLKTIYTDFEQAAILAYNFMFPNARIVGCWFHYSQAITGHWDDLKLVEKQTKEDIESGKIRKKAPREILYLYRNIPLLPASKFEEGLQFIQKLINREKSQWPDLVKFHDYVIGEWYGKAYLLSSFGSQTRSNNHSETFNRSLLRRMEGKHPTLTNFLRNLHNIITVEAQNMDKKFLVHRPKRRQENYEKNKLIADAQKQLIDEEISVEEFLYQVMDEETQESIMNQRFREMEEDICVHDAIEDPGNKMKKITFTAEQYKEDYGAKQRKRRTSSAKERGSDKIKDVNTVDDIINEVVRAYST